MRVTFIDNSVPTAAGSCYRLLCWIIFLIIGITLVPTGMRAQGTWEKDTTPGFDGHDQQTSDVVENKIIVIGGNNIYRYGLVQIFDPVLQTWTTPSFRGDSDLVFSHSSAVIGDSIFVIGGFSDSDISVHIYDVKNNAWITPKTFGSFTPRRNLTSNVVAGKIYSIGGNRIDNGPYTTYTTVQIFDPSSNTWSTPTTSGKFIGRSGHTACVVNGRIYVIGGDTGIGPHCNFLDVFDPSTNTWSTPTTTGTFTPRSYLTSSVLNGKIYVIGGDLGGMIMPCNIVEVFDPATNAWSSAPSMPTQRMQLSSCVLNGKIYVLGGYIPHGGLNAVEVFKPGASVILVSSSTDQTFSVYPNPIPTRTTISFTLPASGAVRLTITDAAGRETPLVASQWFPSGPQEITWDAGQWPNGVYLLRLEASGESITRRVVVMH